MAKKKDLTYQVDSHARWSLFSLLGVVSMKVQKVFGFCHQVEFWWVLHVPQAGTKDFVQKDLLKSTSE